MKVDVVAYRSARLMRVYAKDHGIGTASFAGAEMAGLMETYFKGRMRDGSGSRIRAFFEGVDRGAGAAMVVRVPTGRHDPVEVDVLSPDVEVTTVSRAMRTRPDRPA